MNNIKQKCYNITMTKGQTGSGKIYSLLEKLNIFLEALKSLLALL